MKDLTTSGSISPLSESKYFFRSWSQCSNTKVNFRSEWRTSCSLTMLRWFNSWKLQKTQIFVTFQLTWVKQGKNVWLPVFYSDVIKNFGHHKCHGRFRLHMRFRMPIFALSTCVFSLCVFMKKVCSIIIMRSFEDIKERSCQSTKSCWKKRKEKPRFSKRPITMLIDNCTRGNVPSPYFGPFRIWTCPVLLRFYFNGMLHHSY